MEFTPSSKSREGSSFGELFCVLLMDHCHLRTAASRPKDFSRREGVLNNIPGFIRRAERLIAVKVDVYGPAGQTAMYEQLVFILFFCVGEGRCGMFVMLLPVQIAHKINRNVPTNWPH